MELGRFINSNSKVSVLSFLVVRYFAKSIYGDSDKFSLSSAFSLSKR
jgi:hypothetical protein